MKAYIRSDILCPGCDRKMLPDRKTHTVRCTRPACELCGIEYHWPSVELVPVDRPRMVEHVICGDTVIAIVSGESDER
jgi:hypothetical protein